LMEAGHPVPDSRSVDASERVLEIARHAGPGDTLICLISGGGSALLTSPADGISLQDLQDVTRLLLYLGATITELNAVRKHLSNISGGLLARAAWPAQVFSFILSDVIGSPLDVIASGPTAPDQTTYADALAVLQRHGIADQVPSSVMDRLRDGVEGKLEETPRPGSKLFERVANVVVASNAHAIEAAQSEAKRLGFNAAILSTHTEGEARQVGKVLAGIGKEMLASNRPLTQPSCLLLGGETTVTVRGNGIGGRNTELALSAAIALEGWGPRVVVASFATDGGDGTSPSAGAIADGTTIERGRALGLDAQAALEDNDSYIYWEELGDAIMTGPTGTNVNDIMAVFAFRD
jgi:glycerate 2-kinase